MTSQDEVFLLKNGINTRYFCCDACGHYARGISKRGWCAACEWECTQVGKAAMAKIARMIGVPGYFMRES